MTDLYLTRRLWFQSNKRADRDGSGGGEGDGARLFAAKTAADALGARDHLASASYCFKLDHTLQKLLTTGGRLPRVKLAPTVDYSDTR